MSQLGKKIQKTLKQNKLGESTSSGPGAGVGDSARTIMGNMTNNIAAGTFRGLIGSLAAARGRAGAGVAGMLMIAMLGVVAGVQDTYATASSLSVSVTDGANPSVNIPPTTEGKFVASGATTFTVTTTHAAGYTVTAKSTALKDSTNTISTLTLPSGTSGITADDYDDNDYASTNNLNNTWGYLPSNLCTTSGTTTTCAANTLYLPAPISATQTLDEVSSATGNTYDINIGTRVTTDTAQGAYATTFTVAVVGNATPYTITYVDNSGEATGMPTPNPASGTSDGETATNAVSATVPVRDGYEFKGWCSASTSSESCSGTTYNPDGGGTNRNLTLNQTSATNNFNLYAMWAAVVSCNAGYICYNGNGADAGEMADQSASANSTVMLQAYNYKRAGYGFLGWSTVANPTIGADTIYGPMEDITTPSTLGTKGLVLYAVWLPKSTAYTMQNFSSTTCSNQLTAITYNSSSATFTATANSFIALEDTRDGNVYTVARMTDGFCWMLENLRLDESATNLKNSSYSQGGANFTISALPASTNSFGTGYTTIQWNKNNTDINNTGLTASYNANTAATKWYGYGNYYSWAAARGTTSALSSGDTTTSLCPANWRMPIGNNSTANYSFGKLSTSMGGTSATMNTSSSPTGAVMSARIRHFPNNFVYSGNWYSASAINRGSSGYYWSSTAYDSNNAYGLNFRSTSVAPGTNNSYKYYGRSVRCVAGS